jgi:hypothetical protein
MAAAGRARSDALLRRPEIADVAGASRELKALARDGEPISEIQPRWRASLRSDRLCELFVFSAAAIMGCCDILICSYSVHILLPNGLCADFLS